MDINLVQRMALAGYVQLGEVRLGEVRLGEVRLGEARLDAANDIHRQVPGLVRPCAAQRRSGS